MQQYLQRSKAKFKTIMEAWDDISKNTNLTHKNVGPVHTKNYWKWKILRANINTQKELVCK